MVYVDDPGSMSLTQIYGTFDRAMLRVLPNLRAYSDPLTNAMVEFIQCHRGGRGERREPLDFVMFLRIYHLHFSFLSLSLSIRHSLQWICSLITYTVLVK